MESVLLKYQLFVTVKKTLFRRVVSFVLFDSEDEPIFSETVSLFLETIRQQIQNPTFDCSRCRHRLYEECNFTRNDHIKMFVFKD